MAMVNVLKFRTHLFLFSSKMFAINSTGIHKILDRIANREDPDQSLFGHFWQAISV